MNRELISDTVIPARHGRAFVVSRGQVLRIYLPEGKQVGDCVFLNANDYREQFHVGQSWLINMMLGTGTATSFKHFYSKPPRENILLTVLDDTVGSHWGNMGGRCSKRLYELRDNNLDHRSCQENLAEALAPYGLEGDQIIDIFNVFMNVVCTPDGRFEIHPPTADRGDYIDLLPEMDILAGISACPADTTPTNEGAPKSLGVKIFAAS